MGYYRRKIKFYLRKLSSQDTSYPTELAVEDANKVTSDFIKTTNARVIAEIGTYKGYTAAKFADYLAGQGELHIFDFEDLVADVKQKLNAQGYWNVIAHGNSRKSMDSYNWSLMRILEKNKEPIFDYIFLDGAHVWAIDALTFFLADKLLKPNGYIDFDDYDWTIKKSPSMNPNTFPPTRKMFTQEQIDTQQVALVIELLVRRDKRYREVVKNKIFQKVS